jgi:hypothetical protein
VGVSTRVFAPEPDGSAPVTGSVFWTLIGAAFVSSCLALRVKTNTTSANAATNINPAAITFDKPETPPLEISTVADRLWAAVPGLARFKLFSLSRAGAALLMFVAETRVVYEPSFSDSWAEVAGAEASM